MTPPSLLRISPFLYPATRLDLMAANPATDFPSDLSQVDLTPFGFTFPAATDPPTPGANQVVQEAQPVEINSAWTQQWLLINVPPPPPVADWLGFAGWLYQFPPIAAGMDAARLSTDPQGEPATTGLPTALDEARLRQNYPAFSLTWGLFLLASQMPPEALVAIVAKASERNLPAEFVAALQPPPQEPTP